MATINQYKSGEAAKMVRLAYESMQAIEEPLLETKLAKIFTKSVEDLKPLTIKIDQALEFIKNAKKCAIGDRICKSEFPESPSTCAVFLDELADAMVEVCKAQYASKKAAMAALSDHKGKPLVASKVSGEYREICRTWPMYCFYWNLEKRGLKCLKR
jgi:hypothetical protein